MPAITVSENWKKSHVLNFCSARGLLLQPYMLAFCKYSLSTSSGTLDISCVVHWDFGLEPKKSHFSYSLVSLSVVNLPILASKVILLFFHMLFFSLIIDFCNLCLSTILSPQYLTFLHNLVVTMSLISSALSTNLPTFTTSCNPSPLSQEHRKQFTGFFLPPTAAENQLQMFSERPDKQWSKKTQAYFFSD